MKKAGLPNSSQFSPVQTPLPQLLAIVATTQPDREKVTREIASAFFADRRTRTDIYKLAGNTVIALSQYGIVDKPRSNKAHVTLTPLGQRLAQLAASALEGQLYGEFAKHILVNHRGLDLVNCAQDLIAAGHTPTKHLIIKELAQRGIYHPPNGTHANGMRQWLEQAGLLSKDGWEVNHGVLETLLGTSPATLDALAALTPEQRDFARAFARLNVAEEMSNNVQEYATALFGTDFPEGGLPQSVLFTLRDAGLIECEKTTGGRGAKPYKVRPTELLRNQLTEPLLAALETSAGPQYRRLIRLTLPEILLDLRSPNKHTKGIALEALGFFLARLLDLHFVQWRLRSAKSGGAEIDVVMESDRLVFSRWQIQCKNASQATLEDIAKEVGIAQVIKGNVVLVVCTGRIGSAARQFANRVMSNTSLYVALLDGSHIRELAKNPASIARIMNAQAHGAMAIKRQQVTSP